MIIWVCGKCEKIRNLKWIELCRTENLPIVITDRDEWQETETKTEAHGNQLVQHDDADDGEYSLV